MERIKVTITTDTPVAIEVIQKDRGGGTAKLLEEVKKEPKKKPANTEVAQSKTRRMPK